MVNLTCLKMSKLSQLPLLELSPNVSPIHRLFHPKIRVNKDLQERFLVALTFREVKFRWPRNVEGTKLEVENKMN